MNDIELDERETKMLVMCLGYEKDPFGAPNHILMVLVAKLYKALFNQGRIIMKI